MPTDGALFPELHFLFYSDSPLFAKFVTPAVPNCHEPNRNHPYTYRPEQTRTINRRTFATTA